MVKDGSYIVFLTFAVENYYDWSSLMDKSYKSVIYTIANGQKTITGG